MVTFFQTITGLIGKAIDGSQQGGGGGVNPNPPIENDPQLRLSSESRKYKIYPWIEAAAPIYELRFSDMILEYNIQEDNPEFRIDIFNKNTEELFLSQYSRGRIPTQFSITEQQYNLLNSGGVNLSYLVTYVSSGTDIKSSNTVTCTKEA